MRKLFFFLFVLVAALVMAGCDTVSYLHPLYKDGDLTTETLLTGTWLEDGGSVWTFQERPEQTYSLRLEDPKNEALEFQVRLVQLGGDLFLDATPQDSRSDIAGHTFAWLRVDEGTLELATLKGEWVRKKLIDERVLPFERVRNNPKDTNYVVTASPSEMQTFLMRYIREPEAFDETIVLTRRPGT